MYRAIALLASEQEELKIQRRILRDSTNVLELPDSDDKKDNIEQYEEKTKEENIPTTKADVSNTDELPKNDSPRSIESELDITSEKFDPLRALYAPDYRISQKQPRVLYQNLAAFESAFKRLGIMNLNKRNATAPNKNVKKAGEGPTASCNEMPSSSRNRTVIAEEAQQRRFQPHQMPVAGGRRKIKHSNSIFTYMDNVTGPLLALRQSIKEGRRVRVLVRHEHGVRGSLEGSVIWFDKFWNLWLRNVKEVYQRRKYKYGVNKMCGAPEDCTWRLRELGIELPVQEVKSVNRKNVEIRRELPQLFVRGEQVVLVMLLCKEEKKTIEEKKQ